MYFVINIGFGVTARNDLQYFGIARVLKNISIAILAQATEVPTAAPIFLIIACFAQTRNGTASISYGGTDYRCWIINSSDAHAAEARSALSHVAKLSLDEVQAGGRSAPYSDGDLSDRSRAVPL